MVQATVVTEAEVAQAGEVERAIRPEVVMRDGSAVLPGERRSSSAACEQKRGLR